MKDYLLMATFFTMTLVPLLARFDAEPYLEEKNVTMSNELFYPGFFKKTDPVSLENIIREFKQRYDFFLGISPEPPQKDCFKTQRRINKWLKKLQKKPKTFSFRWADNNLIFDQESPFFEMIRPAPSKAEDWCNYISYGDLQTDGEVFCSYHGPDPQSEFYQIHEHKFIESRPYITAYDITEILIFLPFVMVIPVSWFIMKRFLSA